MFPSFVASVSLAFRNRTPVVTPLSPLLRSFVSPRVARPPARQSRAPRAMSSDAATAKTPPTLPAPPPSVAGRTPVFAQCMLRINNPAKSHSFYTELGMKQLTRFDFPDFSFSLFFYAYTSATPPSMDVPQPERAAWLWARPEPTVELTWNWPSGCADYGAASSALEGGAVPEEIYVSGNEAPRGFSCMQMAVSDVGAGLRAMRAAASSVVAEVSRDDAQVFSATVCDPDGYHVRLVGRRGDGGGADDKRGMKDLDPVFSAVEVRVRDTGKAVAFFNQLGLSVVARRDDAARGESTVYVAYVAEGNEAAVRDAAWVAGELRACAVALRQEWGAEDGAGEFANGNVKPHRGFGHVGVLVDDVAGVTEGMRGAGHKVVREAKPFADVGSISFVAEPSTDYWVEVIGRSGEAPEAPYAQPLPA